MALALLTIAVILFALQAVRARHLILSALWLAGASVILSVVFYLMGAHLISVIELSVGAGLVTVLFVFAINVAGEESIALQPLVPKLLAISLVALSIFLLCWYLIPQAPAQYATGEPPVNLIIWQERSLDILVQITLVFSGVLGLLGILAEAKAPLSYPTAEQVSAKRERDLQALQQELKEETL